MDQDNSDPWDEQSPDSFPDSEQPAPGVGARDLLFAVPLIWAMEMGIAVVMLAWIGFPFEILDHPLVILVITLVSGMMTVLISWLFVCRKYHKTFIGGFLITRPDRKTLRSSLLLGAGLALVASALMLAFSTGESFFAKMASTPQGLAVIGILALLLPFVEELYYRGFIYTALERKFGGSAAAIAVIFWFAAVHCAQNADDPVAILVICVVGIILTVQRQRTGSITASTLTHWAYNACLLLFSLLLLAYRAIYPAAGAP